MNEIMLEMNHISKAFGGNQALKNVHFSCTRGTVHVLAGENGAGKSTLIKLMLGELPLSGQTGKIELLGQEIRQFKDWKKISYVSQNGMASCQNFPASVEEFVQAGLYTQIGKFRFAGKREREQVRRVLHQVGMGDFAKRLIGRLSGGQQQRVLLARALINAPRLLLLDEPSMGLAPLLVKEIFNIIKEINESGTTVLLVEQNANMALSIADKAYVLETGRIALAGTAQELASSEAVRKAYLGG
mgnify:CR=1 FL=1